jgi:hypothetical protein
MRVAIHQGPFDEVPRTVAETGADLVVTAEMSTTGYHIGARTHELAEPADGPTAARLSALAKETGVAVAYGYPETDGEHVYNSYREPFLTGDDISWTAGWAEGAVQTALNAVWGVLHHFGGETDSANPGPGDGFADIAPITLPD